MINLNQYSRQLGLINPEKLNIPIAIIGAGAVGSWLALCLAKMGCQQITVWDGDTVEEHNVGPQVYNSLDLGKSKPEALCERLEFLVENLPTIKNTHWTVAEGLSRFKIVISAVDDIEVRTNIFSSLIAVPQSGQFFLDARMGGNLLRIFAVPTDNKERRQAYSDTLFAKKDEMPIPCSERSVVYNCFVAAGLLADIVGQIANDKIPPSELEIDLTNFTLYGGLE